MNWLFTSIDQGVGALASVFLKNIQGLISFRIDWFNLPWNSHMSSPAPQFESIYSLALSLLNGPTLTSSCDYYSFDYTDKVMSLCFNTLSRFVIAFLPRSKCLLISWLQSPSAVILEPKKVKSVCFHCFPLYFP